MDDEARNIHDGSSPIPLAVIPQDQRFDKAAGGKTMKKILPTVVRRSGRSLGSEASLTLEKANRRAAMKSLEIVDQFRQGGASSVLGSTLVDVLFDTCNRDHLIHLEDSCGMNLRSSTSFVPIEKMIHLEKARLLAF